MEGDEPALVRWTLTVPRARLEVALAELAEAFPDGFEEEVDGDVVHLSGYAPADAAPTLPDYPTGRAAVPPGWRDGWRGHHKPARIGRFWVGPPWLDPDADAEPIVIEPGLAFGTGAHGSTRAAAAVLLRLPAGGAIGDVGCGSGVLSIIAGRLGWGPIAAIDSDIHAVAATRLNARLNGVELQAVVADALVDRLPAGKVLLANLQLEILEPLFARPDLPPTVIVSGLLEREAFAPTGWRAVDEEVVDRWRAIRLER